MIDWLEIRQFAIAEHVELEFDDGFTTITGETGSGKSILIDAIGILLGHRSDTSYLRHNHDTAEIQAGFSLTPGHPASAWLDEQGLDNEQECILRRILRRGKPSRNYINGHAVTVSQLREIGRELVDIHGQNKHHSLLRKPVQLNLVDSASGNDALLIDLQECYRALNDIAARIDLYQDQSQTARQRADLLKFQIEELNELSPRADEWPVLENRHKKLNHLQELLSGARSAASALVEDDQNNVASRLARTTQQLEVLSGFDDSLRPVVQMVEEARILVEEAASQLSPVYQDSDVDPDEIAGIEKRMSLYHFLSRKHRVHPGELSAHLDDMKEELERLTDPESELTRLTKRYQSESRKYRAIADKITANRKRTSRHLGQAVTSILQELGMAGGKFEILLLPADPDRFTRYGNETVEFVVSTNPGQPLQPLRKVASGGELSRMSLGIQVVLANKARVPTLIFDEVDVGIGGEVAHVVGQKLKELGKSAQVICITHLFQIAARGDSHFCVVKQGNKQVETQVRQLSEEQRIEEIARMTVGEKITAQSLAQAREMLEPL